MRIGKVKESILKRSVLRQLHNHSEQGSPAPGEDAGVLFMPEFMPEFTQGFSGKNGVAMAVNPVEGWTFAAKRAVYGAVNSMLAAGAAPKAISLSILMPEEAEEKQLKALIKEIDSLCMQENILVLSGHTAVSPYVSTLILSVTAMGSITRNKENIVVSKESIADSKGNTKQVAVVNADLDLVVAGTVGREGAAMLAAISLMTSLKSLPSLAIRDGFVVTPQITPMSFAFLISSTFAVSIKNFIIFSSVFHSKNKVG